MDILKAPLKLFLICLFISLSDFGYGQAYLSIEPDASGQFIDIVSLKGDVGYVKLVTTDGIYKCDANTCHLIHKVDQGAITFPSKSWSSNLKQVYFPLDDGNHLEYSISGVDYLELEEEGILLKSNDGLWLINDSIKVKTINSFKWQTFNIPQIQSVDYSDIIFCQNDLVISTWDQGVYSVSFSDYNYELKHFSTAKGLMSDYCTAINCRGDKHLIVGHNAGISIIKGFSTRKVNLSKYTSEDILEIESDKYGNIWCMTSSQILMVNEKYEVQIIPLPLADFEEIRAIDIGEGASVNVLTSDRIFIVPKTEIEIFNIRNAQKAERRPVQLYQIRNNYYYTDGQKVYALENNKWVHHRRKKAPSAVVNDSDGNPYLFFNNKGKKYSKINAQLLDRVTIPDGESINNICKVNGKKYYCTDTGLYEYSRGQLILLSHKQDAFYNVVATDSGLFAFAEHSVYRLQNDKTVPLLASYRNTTFPNSVNQFPLDDKLITFNASSIRIIDTKDESILDLNLRPMQILDIKENKALVWVLCEKSLIALDKSALSEGNIEIKKVIPLYEPPLSDGQLYKISDDEIWIQAIDRLYRVDVDDPVVDYMPKIYLDHVNNIKGDDVQKEDGRYRLHASELPAEFVFKSTNRWTENVNYAYYLNHDGKNISEWTKDNIFEFSPESNGLYTLTAKLKDDIYGTNIFNDDINIIVKGMSVGPESSRKPWYWIPIAFLGFFLTWFVVKKV